MDPCGCHDRYLVSNSPRRLQRHVDMAPGKDADLAADRTGSWSGPFCERPLEGALGPAQTGPGRRLRRGRSTPDGLGHQRRLRSELFVRQRRGFLLGLARRRCPHCAQAREGGRNGCDPRLCRILVAEPYRLRRTFPFGRRPRLADLRAGVCSSLSPASGHCRSLSRARQPILAKPRDGTDILRPERRHRDHVRGHFSRIP